MAGKLLTGRFGKLEVKLLSYFIKIASPYKNYIITKLCTLFKCKNMFYNFYKLFIFNLEFYLLQLIVNIKFIISISLSYAK